MITINDLAATIYQPIGMTCNEFAIELAVKYAEEAIKADRLNLLNYVKTYSEYYDMDESPEEFKKFRNGADATILDKYGDTYAIEMFYVDKDSIINAPIIELK